MSGLSMYIHCAKSRLSADPGGESGLEEKAGVLPLDRDMRATHLRSTQPRPPVSAGQH